MATRVGGLTARRSLRDIAEGKGFPYLMVAPTILALSVVGVIPFVYTVFISFQETSFTKTVGFNGLGNFSSLVTDPLFWTALDRKSVV